MYAWVLLLPLAALADLPVHCVHREILGHWELRLSESDKDSSATCGHNAPDRIMTMVEANVSPASPRFAVARTLKVELKNPNIVIGPDGHQGSWTTVYDEAFEISLDNWKVRALLLFTTKNSTKRYQSELQYMTFFRYSPRFAGADPNKVEQFRSFCNETVTGWYRQTEAPLGKESRGWGCFVAAQSQRAIALDSEEYSHDLVAKREGLQSGDAILSPTNVRFADSLQDDEEASAARAYMSWSATNAWASHGAVRANRQLRAGTSSRASFLEAMSLESVSCTKAIEALQSHDKAQALVDHLNTDSRRLWRAAVPEHLVGISHSEAQRRLGHSAVDKIQHHAIRHSSSPNVAPQAAVEVDISAFPKQLDWSTKDGGKYVPSVLDQGNCGSCYAVAASDAITSRARIRAKGALDHLTLSVQSALQCSSYNQGCDGGYPFLVGKFGADVGFVPSECMQYSASSSACPASIDCPQLAQVLPVWKQLQSKQSSFLEVDAQELASSASSAAARTEAVASALRTELRVAHQAADLQPFRDFVPISGLQANLHAAAMAHQEEPSTPVAGILLETNEAHDDASSVGPLGYRRTDAAQNIVDAATRAADAVSSLSEQTARFADTTQERVRESTLDFDDIVAVAHDHSGQQGAAVHTERDGTTANTYALADRLRSSRYEYVGGYYGACSASAMIKELQDGPIAVALNAPGDLFFYSGGIYQHSMKPEAEYDVTKISRWEKTNHAVLLVGYGEEVVNGQTVLYWKLKNSWGARWGEPADHTSGQRGGGYFRMVRGVDMVAVESMAVVIDP